MSMRYRWIVGIAIAVLLLAVAIYMTRWRDPPSASGPGGRGGLGQPVSVRVAEARSGSIDVVVDALGTVLARNTSVVRARVDGLLQRIVFQEGREVAGGALLAEIDPRPFDAALEQVQGQLIRDQSLLAIARSDLDRYQTLLAQDSIAKQQVDDQVALVHQYQGAVQADQGAVDNARLQRDFTRITAPIAGRVGLRQVDVGNIVHASDLNGIVVLTQTRPINVVFAVPADRAPEVQRRWHDGAKLQVDAFDRDGKTLLATGTLESVDNLVDPATSTVKLKAVFSNSDAALIPNQFVNARITLATLDNQILVPAPAVQRGTPGTFVYVVGDDKTVSIRPVKLGVTNGDTVAMTAGLKVGERVVVDGTDKLRDGAKVEAPVEAPAHPAGRKSGKAPGAGRPDASRGAADATATGRGERRRPDPAGAQK